ncbi:LysM peptidoglycan-binding domain-containing protein [Bacillus shivajii]|uniref:LysM peptidoglycan-binding domain-containing protein n=1 Tax=Bacillus shivajii TaxID=1983719 RepID=UPI001CFBD573|nr:LysM peptidoglycan-binding domain-containing protein [Bacillus shivajii]UCZ51447.1 LysM peptidoglycan-binding domain-containing protein [Bacillus shivajii]
MNIVVNRVNLNLNPSPFIENGVTFIPIRAISTHFGAGVSWNGEDRSVSINKGETNISFVVGQTTAKVNERQVNVPPSRIVNKFTFVPVRFISETFGYDVEWNGKTWSVFIESTPNTYTVVSGDNLWSISNKFGISVHDLRNINNLQNDVLQVGQTLIVSTQEIAEPDTTPPQEETLHYTVVSGDTLSRIASRFNTTVETIMTENNLTSDKILVNQVLRITTTVGQDPGTVEQGVTKTYTTHTVQSGDNAWNISIQYGIPMLELLQVNNLSLNSTLFIGQRLTIPVYDIPVKPVVSSRHGEFLDWWTEARYVFPIGKEATVTDFQSGRTFRIRHTMGGNHADCEPLSSTDAETMRQLWGGTYSWTPRAVIITVDGRRLAAAMHSFPHGDHIIRNNNYPGHFCIHFLNSTRHNDGLVQASMQTQVRVAAGVN